MREEKDPQLSLFHIIPRNEIGKELEAISKIITRLLIEGKSLSPTPAYRFADHRRVVKKRAMKLLNSKKETVRKNC